MKNRTKKPAASQPHTFRVGDAATCVGGTVAHPGKISMASPMRVCIDTDIGARVWFQRKGSLGRDEAERSFVGVAMTSSTTKLCTCPYESEARCDTSEGPRCLDCARNVAARTGEWIAEGNSVLMGADNRTYCEGGKDDYAAALEIVAVRRALIEVLVKTPELAVSMYSDLDVNRWRQIRKLVGLGYP